MCWPPVLHNHSAACAARAGASGTACSTTGTADDDKQPLRPGAQHVLCRVCAHAAGVALWVCHPVCARGIGNVCDLVSQLQCDMRSASTLVGAGGGVSPVRLGSFLAIMRGGIQSVSQLIPPPCAKAQPERPILRTSTHGAGVMRAIVEIVGEGFVGEAVGTKKRNEVPPPPQRLSLQAPALFQAPHRCVPVARAWAAAAASPSPREGYYLGCYHRKPTSLPLLRRCTPHAARNTRRAAMGHVKQRPVHRAAHARRWRRRFRCRSFWVVAD